MPDSQLHNNVHNNTITTTPKKKGGRPKGSKNRIPAALEDDRCGFFTIKARLRELKKIATTASSEQARVNAINAVTKLLNDALTKNEDYKITTIVFEEVPDKVDKVDKVDNVDKISTNSIIKSEESIVEAVKNTEVSDNKALTKQEPKQELKDEALVGNANSNVSSKAVIQDNMAELDVEIFRDLSKKDTTNDE